MNLGSQADYFDRRESDWPDAPDPLVLCYCGCGQRLPFEAMTEIGGMRFCPETAHDLNLLEPEGDEG